MSDRHWPSRSWQRQALVTSVLAVAGTAAVAGCGGGGSSSSSQTAAAQTPTASATASPVTFSSAQLKAALLDEVNGSKPASAAESGNYGSLPDVQTSKQTMNGVKVNPAKCAAASQTGFNSAAFTNAPASVVTFKVGNDGVSEVLVSTSPQAADTALSNRLPSGCEHYSATVDGKTFKYSVKESALSGVAQQARALNVKAAGYASVDVWSVVYRGTGFVGAVTMVGPDATEAGVKDLAKAAYAHASQSLTAS
jgi:hypothetical protein